MKRLAALIASWLLATSQAAFAQAAPPPPAEVAETVSPPPTLDVPLGEEPVDPYEKSNKNAGAAPFEGTQMLEAFHGREGIGRIVADLVSSLPHSRIADVFRATDMKRLERTLNEQFCYILNGGCDYTGRDMKTTHEDQGVTRAEFGALVELLQDAMDAEHVLPSAQNRFLAKLAPMNRDVVVR
jgi:hemoglobin